MTNDNDLTSRRHWNDRNWLWRIIPELPYHFGLPAKGYTPIFGQAQLSTFTICHDRGRTEMERWNMCLAALGNGQTQRRNIWFHVTCQGSLIFVKISARLCGECVILNECPVHNMATWIHHLTKVQQMRLMRSIFRCCA